MSSLLSAAVPGEVDPCGRTYPVSSLQHGGGRQGVRGVGCNGAADSTLRACASRHFAGTAALIRELISVPSRHAARKKRQMVARGAWSTHLRPHGTARRPMWSSLLRMDY